MCIPKNRQIIAICGQSCVGKSTLATELGRTLKIPVRYCGYVVVSRANELAIDPRDLPVTIHRQIDNETRDLAGNARTSLIIEGAYLAYVLNGIAGIKLIHLKCCSTVRENRLIQRSVSNRTPNFELSVRDRDHEVLRGKLYKSVSSTRKPWMILDTSKLNQKQVLDRVLAKLGQCVDDD
jgi:cytidylate kinase